MFTQPLGHSAVQTQLAAQLVAGTLPHALLLHGPQGIGKATLGRWLAARLICGGEEGARNPLTPSKKSFQWQQLMAGSCPDLHLLQVTGDRKEISVKYDVPQFFEGLMRSADGAKVGLIDAMDDLNTHSANMLLKMLEEPMPGTYIILVCHQLSAVLPTIKSRCRLVKMGVLSEAETASVLAAQGAEMAEAPLAQGCPGVWLTLSAAQKAALNGLQHGNLPSANTPDLLNILQQHLANQAPTYQTARLYQQFASLKTQQATLNLPGPLVHEHALRLISAHLQLTTNS